MANYAVLKAAIEDVIKTNGNNEITGQLLQDTLIAMINSLGAEYQFAGVATNATNPGTPDHNVFYIAGAGTYPNFGATNVPIGCLGIFMYNGNWIYNVKEVTDYTLVNVNDLINQSTPFASAGAARSAIPQQNRKAGLNIIYLLNTGENTSQWVQDMFIGDDVADWGVADNWKVMGPVSILQNTETGKKELHIGREIAMVVEDTPEEGNKNPISSEGVKNNTLEEKNHPISDTDVVGYFTDKNKVVFGKLMKNGSVVFLELNERDKSIDELLANVSSEVPSLSDVVKYLTDKDGRVIATINNVAETQFYGGGGFDGEVTKQKNIGFNAVKVLTDNKNSVIGWITSDGKVHIIELEVDSISYKFSSKFKGKKLAIIGDSISTYSGWLPSNIPGYDGATYAYYYNSSNLGSVENTWWYQVAQAIGLDPNKDINVCAWSGSRVTSNGIHDTSSSTTDAYMGCSTRRITDLSIRGYNPDIVICFISCNDWGHDIPLGDWAITNPIPTDGEITTARAGYALMLAKIQRTYPHARIFCCTNLDDYSRDHDEPVNMWPSENNNGVTTHQWNQNIIEIASAFGCDIIDVHSCGINYNNIATYYAVDAGLHPNARGHKLMAQKVIAELNAKY